MTTEITLRRVCTKDLKETVVAQLKGETEARIRELGDRLSENFPAVEHLRAFVDVEGQDVIASLSVQGGQATTVEAVGKDSETAVAAVNNAFDKAMAQLRRASEKRQSVR